MKRFQRWMSTNLNPSNATPIMEHSPSHALTRKQLPSRTGLLALKKGMTGIWDAQGRKIPITILQLDRPQVTAIKTVSQHGYHAIQIGAGIRSPSNINRAQLGQFSLAGVHPKQHLTEFRTLTDIKVNIGDTFQPSHFQVGQKVDLKATSKGKGFAGVMKRYGFKGLRASHGVSLSHRSAGSTGQSQDPGRVLPGKKMAGRLGGKSTTIQRVEVVEVDDELGIICVRGPVPGPKDGWVKVQDSIKA